ncbi:MAG: SpoVR family protein [Desulfuromonadaceae bacterium GWC2_58_13]|nr:MAG: SpoVR family protein [Desulfuromonadaceae bacterium GWC2_58_13]
MELISQHTKKIMEGCKERARDAGLRFDNETLEYIVTNRDMIELSPKVMIPTLYDYWVQDVEVLKEKGRYELYPGNPYETVINTRPAISFYNDNNPDWLNVMIFYHVLAHIDFFQNNTFFRHTWDFDLTGRALADKRLIAKLRSEKGRWVDYVIEFSRGVDNLVGYFDELSRLHRSSQADCSRRLDYYLDVFLQQVKKVKINQYVKEIERFNDCRRKYGERGESTFFADTAVKYPEFEALFEKSSRVAKGRNRDLLQFLMDHSEFLNKEENKWMKMVMEVVRKTSIYFQPQIRTKIMNEGWASYWHEKLYMQDERIRGHEIEFARAHAGVTAMPRVGMNPYALGMRLFYFIEEMADKGKLSYDFERLLDIKQREKYDRNVGAGLKTIFDLRENFCDFMFVNTFVDQDFVDKNKLFVADRRMNQERMTWEIYVKSRKAEDYRQMVLDSLYHPPWIELDQESSAGKTLKLIHRFEGKPLVSEYIANTMLGIEFLWGGPVQLETSEVDAETPAEVGSGAPAFWTPPQPGAPGPAGALKWRRVLYEMKDRQLSRVVVAPFTT